MIHKVTVFITRATPTGCDLLLIEHPYAGIQLPAGTVEAGESPRAAARREAAEETGLTAFIHWKSLGFQDERLPQNQRVVNEATALYARPARSSFDWARLPRGITVHVEHQASEFTQITYREFDRLEPPRHISYQLTGWVPNTALTGVRRRHFFHMDTAHSDATSWWIETDGHRWRLFWASTEKLPPIVASQANWLAHFNRHVPGAPPAHRT